MSEQPRMPEETPKEVSEIKFEMCNCGSPFPHAYLFFEGRDMRWPAVFSLSMGRLFFEHLKSITHVSPQIEEALVNALNSSGLPENDPADEEVQAYLKNKDGAEEIAPEE